MNATQFQSNTEKLVGQHEIQCDAPPPVMVDMMTVLVGKKACYDFFAMDRNVT